MTCQRHCTYSATSKVCSGEPTELLSLRMQGSSNESELTPFGREQAGRVKEALSRMPFDRCAPMLFDGYPRDATRGLRPSQSLVLPVSAPHVRAQCSLNCRYKGCNLHAQANPMYYLACECTSLAGQVVMLTKLCPFGRMYTNNNGIRCSSADDIAFCIVSLWLSVRDFNIP